MMGEDGEEERAWKEEEGRHARDETEGRGNWRGRKGEAEESWRRRKKKDARGKMTPERGGKL